MIHHRWLHTIQNKAVSCLVLIAMVIVINFTLLHLAPGDIAETLAGEMGAASPEFLASIRQQYGLDQPFLIQLWLYIGKFLQLDFGQSYYYNQTVWTLFTQRLYPTLVLTITAAIFSFIIGITLGSLAAYKPRSILDRVLTALATSGYAVPVFGFAMLMIVFFTGYLRWLPASGMHTIGAQLGFWASIWDLIQHLIMPASSLILIYSGIYMRIMRASVLEQQNCAYTQFAFAKGQIWRKVFTEHMVPNAWLAPITVFGLQLGSLLSGAVVVENIFNWPGLGILLRDSLVRRDTPVISGVLILSSIVVILCNTLIDLLYEWLDPRVRIQ